MSTTKLIPREENILGSSLTSSDAAKNRTYTLTNSDLYSVGLEISVNGTTLHTGSDKDFTVVVATGVITFLNKIWDTNIITINYYTETTTPTFSITTTTQYCTTLQVFEYLNLAKEIPNYPTTTTLETVDVSTSIVSGSVIYLDKGKVIEDTQTISYGTSATSVTALTETTHYTIDNERGRITITASGASAIGSNKVYATYQYNDYINDSYVSDLIDRSTKDIDQRTTKTWQGLTLTTREEQLGRGAYSRMYKPRKMPLYLVRTQLSADITASDTSITMDSTNGLEEDDYLSIGTEVVSIDSVDNTTTLTVTRGALGSTAATHSDDDWVVNVVVEISNTPVGNEPNYSITEFRDDYDVDSGTGAIQLLYINAEDRDDLAPNVYPLPRIFNRIRFTYKYGAVSVPTDITELCILMTAYSMSVSSIARALPIGIDGFSPTAQQTILNEIDKILKEHRTLKIGGF